jgi:prepilin-type N-terminal cleavage/methylation domain-containing protein
VKENFHYQKGLTLIEVLASIVILSIVLLSFITFFTNSFRLNSFSAGKMDATNLARETQEKFKVDNDISIELKNLITQSIGKTGTMTFPKNSFPKLNVNQDITLVNKILQLSITNPVYQVIVFVDTEPVPGQSTPLPLYKLHVQVSDNGKRLSETYTYVEF